MPVEFKQDSIKEWITSNLDEDTISDVVLNGCQGGTIGELIYYADTNAFYEKYQEEIWQMLWDSYSDCGSDSILHFIETFKDPVTWHQTCSLETCWRGTLRKKCVAKS